MYNITDNAVECVKHIVDNNRCESCDNLDGERVRHQCGHYYCGDCVATLGHCLVCTTPPDVDKKTLQKDSPATQRANNAAQLLNTFQKAFNVNVYLKSRISDQLRVEKEVFPDCIQAPVKYHNKRKSSIGQSNKENRWKSFLPGELISPGKPFKMENSVNYVQHWLDSNVKDNLKESPRKAFADLNVNSPNVLKRRIPKRPDLILQEDKKELGSPPKKRKTSFKTSLALVKKQSLLDNYLKPDDKRKKDFKNIKEGFKTPEKNNTANVVVKSDKDESGIVIDDDDLIVIDDSQSQVVDKDKLAWQAVLEANEKSPYVSQSLNLERSDIVKISDDRNNKVEQNIPCNNVPFYKKSYLRETCYLCIKSKYKTTLNNQIEGQHDDILITVENDSLKATIKMMSVKDRPPFEKHSVSIQTDAHDPECDLGKSIKPSEKQIDAVLHEAVNEPMLMEREISSQDLFTAEIKHRTGQKSELLTKQSAQLIISDSDSDDAANESQVIEVSAEVHHYKELEHQVLGEIVPDENQHRTRRSKRGQTPNSTDSSEKENFDPNRSKRLKINKKPSKKRKIHR